MNDRSADAASEAAGHPVAGPAAPGATRGVATAHDDHAADPGGHDGEGLGPVDLAAWGAGLLGILIGLAMGLAFVIATNRLPT